MVHFTHVHISFLAVCFHCNAYCRMSQLHCDLLVTILQLVKGKTIYSRMSGSLIRQYEQSITTNKNYYLFRLVVERATYEAYFFIIGKWYFCHYTQCILSNAHLTGFQTTLGQEIGKTCRSDFSRICRECLVECGKKCMRIQHTLVSPTIYQIPF